MNAVITGATKGIGRAIAIQLLSMDYNLAICSRNQDDLNVFQEEMKARFPKREVQIFKVDVSHEAEVKKFAVDLLQKLSSIDILVNNAGVFLPGESLLEDEGNLSTMIDTNLFSAYHLTRGLIKALIAAKGYIFNICSIASTMSYPGGGSYSISKFAMYGFNKVIREELKTKNVRVTAILPGSTWSNSWKGVDLPEDRLMQAEDIAKIVANCIGLGRSANVEEIVVRPQLGDL